MLTDSQKQEFESMRAGLKMEERAFSLNMSGAEAAFSQAIISDLAMITAIHGVPRLPCSDNLILIKERMSTVLPPDKQGIGEWLQLRDRVITRFGWAQEVTSAQADRPELFHVYLRLVDGDPDDFKNRSVTYDILVQPSSVEVDNESDFYKGFVTLNFREGRLHYWKLDIPSKYTSGPSYRSGLLPWLPDFIEKKLRK